jgi:hypothetical protein
MRPQCHMTAAPRSSRIRTKDHLVGQMPIRARLAIAARWTGLRGPRGARIGCAEDWGPEDEVMEKEKPTNEAVQRTAGPIGKLSFTHLAPLFLAHLQPHMAIFVRTESRSSASGRPAHGCYSS